MPQFNHPASPSLGHTIWCLSRNKGDTRTKAINRKLREVEALPTDQAAALLPEMNDESIMDED